MGSREYLISFSFIRRYRLSSRGKKETEHYFTAYNNNGNLLSE